MTADIAAISVSDRIAVLDDGTQLPITNLLDAFGDETEEVDDAVTFVCGAGSLWLAAAISDFSPPVLH